MEGDRYVHYFREQEAEYRRRRVRRIESLTRETIASCTIDQLTSESDVTRRPIVTESCFDRRVQIVKRHDSGKPLVMLADA